ncbi:ABC transporter permease [Paraburkholderia sp. DGU8]|uniref:ABC transporter permease n=1 Tax=Paraburkholderia sp. DGU8 TaxID=3161997 RepID=UPI003467C140
MVPLGLTVVISFWKRVGFGIRPDVSLAAYASFLRGLRLEILERSLIVATEVTVIGVLVAYPIAWFLAMKASPRATRVVLMLFTIPFLVNYVIRTFSWSYLLGRTGPVNAVLMASGITAAPLDWLLYSDFAVLIGLLTSYVPFMIFPLWLSISGIDRRLIQASWLLGAKPTRTFLRITLPLSMPGVFAAIIFGFVGSFGDSAVPVILGGTGYQLIGNEITSTLDVLNYPLAAAMSTVVLMAMLVLLGLWFGLFDLRSFLGKALKK